MVAVDCCEGGGLQSYKGIMILLLAVKGFQVEKRGNKNASNLDVSTTCCDMFASVDAFWWVISFSMGKASSPGLPHRICVPRLN
eukprot:scaffold215304_cov55-Attheya_sp.AAC.1